MIAIYIKLGDENTGRLTFDKRSIKIGSDQRTNDLILRDGAVADAHCELELADDNTWCVRPFELIDIDGKRVERHKPIAVRDGARLALGNYTVVLALQEPALSRDPTEASLLAEILHGDLPSREVYADWLDTRGAVERAEFLRMQDRPSDAGAVMRARILCDADGVDYAWRRRVSRGLLEGCGVASCPGDWGALEPSGRPELRNCATCGHRVRYVRDRDEAQRRGGRVVVDLAGAIVPAPGEQLQPFDDAAADDDSRASTAEHARRPSAWIATQEWRAGDLTPLVAQLYPEAMTRGPIQIRGNHPHADATLREHSLARVFFGSGGGTDFESWSGLFAMGTLGFARISGRPNALSQLLAAERYQMPLHSIMHEFFAVPFAAAFGDEHGPDTWNKEDRELHMRSGMLRRFEIERMDGGRGGGGLLPADPARWSALRSGIAPATITATGDVHQVTFCMADAIGRGLVRISRYVVLIEPVSFALSAQRTVLGELACSAPPMAVPGRPFVVDGVEQRAPVVRRDDWG